MLSKDTRFPSIDALRAFEAAARLGSFEKASEELSITASALSKRISSLEIMIGAALFDRLGRAVQLTVSGREYAEQVRQVLNQLGSISLHSKALQSSKKLRVVAPPTFAREILIPHLASFTAKHTALEIEVVVAIPFLNVEAPAADIVIGFGPKGITQPLLFEAVFVVAAPGFAKKYQVKQVADLVRAKAPPPLVRCPIEPWAPWFAAQGLSDQAARSVAKQKGGLKLVDLGLMLEAAASGYGAALGRASIVNRWLENGSLVRLFPTLAATSLEGYSLTVRNASPQAVSFSQWLQGICKKLESSSLD
jgi:LysR family transcriptional regulator, glycine cleavage system transcriptional activator